MNEYSFKKLVTSYLEFMISEDFNMCYELSDEIILTENIMSKKIIIVQNFSEKIAGNFKIKKYLETIIANINLRLITAEEMRRIVSN